LHFRNLLVNMMIELCELTHGLCTNSELMDGECACRNA
jgi:hypothetical protein